MKKWKQRFRDMEDAHERSQVDFREQYEDNKKLRSKYSDLEKARDSARTSLADWKKMHRQVEDDLNQLKSDNATLQADIDSEQAKSSALDIAVAELTEQLGIARKEAQDAVSSTEKLQAEKEELATIPANKSQESVNLSETSGTEIAEEAPVAEEPTVSANDSTEIEETALEAEVAPEQSAPEQEQEEIQKEEEETSTAELLNSRESEISSLSSRLALLMHERNTLKKKWDSALSSGAKIRSDLKSYVIAKDESVEKLRKQQADLKEELRLWKEKYKGKEDHQRKLQSQLVSLERDKVAQSKNIQQLKNADLLHQVNLEKLHRQLNKLYVNSERMQGKLAGKAAELEKMNGRMDDRQTKIDSLEFDISDQIKKYRTLQAKLSDERDVQSKEREKWEHLKTVEEENEKLKNRLDKWKDDLKKEKAISKESRERVEVLKVDLKKKEREVNSRGRKLEALEKEFENENRNFGLANIDLTNWKLRFKKKSDEADRLEKLSKSLQQKADKLARKEARLEKSLGDLKDRLKPLEKSYAELQSADLQNKSQRKKLENRLVKATEWKEKNEPVLRTLRSQVKDAEKLSKKQLQELEKKAKESLESNKKLQAENKRLEVELGQISGLMEKLESLVKGVPQAPKKKAPKKKGPKKKSVKATEPKPKPIRPGNAKPKVEAVNLSPQELAKKEALQRVRKWRSKIDFDRLGKFRARQKEDLKVIKGIGPFIEEKLNVLGIYRLEQIAKIGKQDEEIIDQAIETFPGRISRENWVKQAKDLS